MAETKDKPLQLTLLIKCRLKEGEMEKLRQAGGGLSSILAEGLAIKLDKLVGSFHG
jgi:hypothetical protein